MKKTILKIIFALTIMASKFLYADTIRLDRVYLDSVVVITSNAFGHHAGNLEIKVTNGIGNPVGVNCDQNYITTRNTVANYKELVSVLLLAQAAQKPVELGITDDPNLTAYDTRCSLVSAGLLK